MGRRSWACRTRTAIRIRSPGCTRCRTETSSCSSGGPATPPAPSSLRSTDDGRTWQTDVDRVLGRGRRRGGRRPCDRHRGLVRRSGASRRDLHGVPVFPLPVDVRHAADGRHAACPVAGWRAELPVRELDRAAGARGRSGRARDVRAGDRVRRRPHDRGRAARRGPARTRGPRLHVAGGQHRHGRVILRPGRHQRPDRRRRGRRALAARAALPGEQPELPARQPARLRGG